MPVHDCCAVPAGPQDIRLKNLRIVTGRNNNCYISTCSANDSFTHFFLLEWLGTALAFFSTPLSRPLCVKKRHKNGKQHRRTAQNVVISECASGLSVQYSQELFFQQSQLKSCESLLLKPPCLLERFVLWRGWERLCVPRKELTAFALSLFTIHQCFFCSLQCDAYSDLYFTTFCT